MINEKSFLGKIKINIIYIEILFSFLISFIFWSPLFNDSTRFLWGDFDYFITALFINKVSILHFKEFPFFSSYVGGGFPHWANPQNMLFSVPELISFLFRNQWVAIRVSVLFISAISMIGMFSLLRQLEINNIFCRLFGAIVYTFSGFFVTHLIYGHFTFSNMAYLPFLASAFVWSWKSQKFSYAIPFLLAIMVYSGYSICSIFIIIFLFSFLVFNNFKKWIIYILFGILLSAPKLIASYELVSLFPRNLKIGKISDSLFGIIKNLLISLFWPPNQKFDFNPYRIKGVYVWENNGYIGIICAIFTIYGIYYLLKDKDYKYRRFGISMLIIIGVFVFLYPGDLVPIWSLLSKNLIIGMLHMPSRFVGLLLLPIAFFSTIYIYYLSTTKFFKKWQNAFFIILSLFIFMEYTSVNRRNILLIRRFTFLESEPHFAAGKEFSHSPGPKWEIGTLIDETQLMINYIEDNEGVLRYYEPLLGYSGSAFPSHSSVKEGKLNVFNTEPDVKIKWLSPSKIGVEVFKRNKKPMKVPININFFPGWSIVSKQLGVNINSTWTPADWGLLTLHLDENFPIEKNKNIILKYIPSWKVRASFVVGGLAWFGLFFFIPFFEKFKNISKRLYFSFKK